MRLLTNQNCGWCTKFLRLIVCGWSKTPNYFGSSSKKFYNYVNKKIKTHSSIPPLCGINGNLITADSEKTDAFNQYFQSVFTRDNGSSAHPTKKEFIPMPPFKITKYDILAAVRKLKACCLSILVFFLCHFCLPFDVICLDVLLSCMFCVTLCFLLYVLFCLIYRDCCAVYVRGRTFVAAPH